jgi:hypothetical protein
LSETLLVALCMGPVAVMFTWFAIDMLRDGSTSNWFYRDTEVRRADGAGKFWFWWSGWCLAAAFWWFMGVRWMLQSYAEPDPEPAGWPMWIMASLPLLMLALVARGRLRSHRLWRRGNPLRATTRARLRREATLRGLIRNLADDPATGWDDENLDQLVDSADFAYLDAVAAHLLAQPEPRRLALAVAALRDEEFPLDPDDRAHLIEFGIDPDAPLEDDDEEAKAPP